MLDDRLTGLHQPPSRLQADTLGIQQVFLGVLVILMLVNAVVLGALSFTYPRDARRVTEELTQRRAAVRGR